MKQTLSLTTLVCAAALLGNAAMAGGEKLQFSADDRDGNGSISESELVTKLEDGAVFDKLDVNDNRKLEEAEADNDLIEYNADIDVDKSGWLDRKEFTAAILAHFDKNEDKRLDEGEYSDFAEQASEALKS